MKLSWRDTLSGMSLYRICVTGLVYEFLADFCRRPSRMLPYIVERFPGAVFANRIPSSHGSFVDAERNSLVERGCVVNWSDIRRPSGLVGPRLIRALSVKEPKPR